MTHEEFWQIVEAANWNLVGHGRSGEECFSTLRALLSTVEVLEEFRLHHSQCSSTLASAIGTWEHENAKVLEISDDSLTDLLDHIIGLGREEYTRSIKDPSLAYNRSRAADGSDEGYRESFAYCIPYPTDYEPVEVRLERAQAGLEYWIEQYSETHDESARDEVRYRQEEVAMLGEEARGVKSSPVGRHGTLKAVKIASLQKRIKFLKSKSEEIVKLLDDAYEELEALEPAPIEVTFQDH